MTIELTVIETVHQTSDIDGFTYRITVTSDKCGIKRVPTEDMLWSHGMIAELYQTDSEQFEQICQTSSAVSNVGTLDNALRIIAAYKNK